jgi:putative ABC transport system permease protein
MILSRWIKGLFTYGSARIFGAIAGIAVTIAMLGSLGTFLASSSSTLTRRAISDVPVDWQVLLTGRADGSAVREAIGKSTSVAAMEEVGYADVGGFVAATGGTVQTTGPGKVLGISPEYRSVFPMEIRQLTGLEQGVLVFQQTAANLHVKEGDSITIKRTGLPPVQAKVAGVVDLPYADSLFQAIGVPSGTAPQAPPDDVVLIPGNEWHRLFDPQAKIRPDTVHLQFHVRIGHDLPANPVDAYARVTHLSNNLEASIAGGGIVGNNIAARLSAVRADALYAGILFLFLGLPGAVLSILLTIAIIASGKEHRLKEQALLRTRGASIGQILKFETMEAVIVGIGGTITGIAFAVLAGSSIAPVSILKSNANLFQVAGAAVAGFVLAVIAVLYPAYRQARMNTVSSSRPLVRATGKALWRKLYLDVLLLVVSSFVYWKTASTGYQVVLAPEGVSQVSVHYDAFIAPFCLWVGGVLFAIRLWENSLERRRGMLSRLLKPVAGNLSGIVASSISRQRVILTRGVVLVALAMSFAVSTAIFNTTYNAQSLTDARLTNGSDVTVRGVTAFPPGSKLVELRSLPGVSGIQAMMHRFAYVGNDLQDMYGIDPEHIGDATGMSNAYFAGGDAKATLSLLAKNPDGVLVSEETRQDFQLHEGDRLNLRLQFASDHQYHVVPFRFSGVAREFPTAPKDSFLVANATYIAEKTGINAREIVLMKAKDDPLLLSRRAQEVVSSIPGARVTDIGSVRKAISSSLTSVDLHGLTRLELMFAVLLVMGATGLILVLSLNERRRNFAILDALGARSSQLGAFIWSEGLLILVGGALIGALLGFGIAWMLVKVLTGAFDPPPEHLFVPWNYLMSLVVSALGSTIVAVFVVKTISHRPVVEELRKL